MENKATGKIIRQLRDKKAWTQEQLAEHAKVSARTIQRAEEGVMSAETLNVLARTFKVDVETLSTAAEPDGYPAVTPVLFYQHPDTLDWLEKVFGVEIIMRYIGQDNTIQHAELAIGKGRIMAGQPIEARNWSTPALTGVRSQSLYVMLTDVDSHYRHARQNGAQILSEPENSHGHRRYLAEDPEGHHWWFAAPLNG